jgi:hypothetical protein
VARGLRSEPRVSARDREESAPPDLRGAVLPMVPPSAAGQPDGDLAGAPGHDATASADVPGPDVEPAFERNALRVLAAGFAVFIVLTAIKVASVSSVATWRPGSVVSLLAVLAVLIAMAIKGLPRDDGAEIETSPRFYELADPTRPLTDEDMRRSNTGPS